MHRYPRRYLLIAAMAISAITSLDVALWATAGAAPEPRLLKLYYFVVVILLVAWLAAEPRTPAENRPSFDHGYLHWTTFPILAVYEQFVCRGGKGIAIVLGLLLILFAPNLVWGFLVALG